METGQFTVELELISPYKGKLVNLVVSGEEREELMHDASHLPSVQLSSRSLCDIELLATGALSPLDRFISLQGKQSHSQASTNRFDFGNPGSRGFSWQWQEAATLVHAS